MPGTYSQMSLHAVLHPAGVGWQSSRRLPIHEFRPGSGAGTSLVATARRPFGSGILRTAYAKTPIQRQIDATDKQIDQLV